MLNMALPPQQNMFIRPWVSRLWEHRPYSANYPSPTPVNWEHRRTQWEIWDCHWWPLHHHWGSPARERSSGIRSYWSFQYCSLPVLWHSCPWLSYQPCEHRLVLHMFVELYFCLALTRRQRALGPRTLSLAASLPALLAFQFPPCRSSSETAMSGVYQAPIFSGWAQMACLHLRGPSISGVSHTHSTA